MGYQIQQRGKEHDCHMDFIIILGLKFLFDLLWPESHSNSSSKNNTDEAAAFWFGTSYENLDHQKDSFLNDSDYDQHP
jgi:hypothetical protein